NRIHWREAMSLKSAGYDVGVHAVAASDEGGSPVKVSQAPRRSRLRRVSIGTLQALRTALRSEAEIIHIHDPELIWTIPVLRIAGRKVIYDAHEDLPAQVLDKSYLPKPTRKFARWGAKGLVMIAGVFSSGVVAATETIAERFDEEKTTVVRNFPHVYSKAAAKVEVGKRSPNVVYVGGISESRGGTAMVDALGSSKMPSGWQLLLAGQVSSSYLHDLQQKPGWEKIEFYGKVLPLESREIIRESRIGLVVLKDTTAYRDSLPTKMFEYLAEGVAVIASDFPLWRSIIERYDCGVLVDEDSPDAIATAIADYANDEELLRRHSRNGMDAAAKIFNWDREAEYLMEAYRAILGS